MLCVQAGAAVAPVFVPYYISFEVNWSRCGPRRTESKSSERNSTGADELPSAR